LTVTIDQLFLMIEENDKVQYKVLRIINSLLNYGGRVTDSKDERYIKTAVCNFINHNMINFDKN